MPTLRCAPARPADALPLAALAGALLVACGGGGGAGPVAPPPEPSATCGTPARPATWPGAAPVVGTGTSASCTEAALDAALAAGGHVTFACGASPVTITVTSEKVVAQDTWLDGGGLVTLSGGGTTRILGIHNSFERPGPALRVEGLTFRDGHATGTAIPLGTDVDGGGGAIFHLGGTVTAVDCQFLDNQAATWGPDVAGGAISGIGNPAATSVYRCTFRGNRAANGGAIGSLHTAVTIVDSTFEQNEAAGRGANSGSGSGQTGNGGNGGALSMDGENRRLSICGTTFHANQAGAFGGAIFRTSYHEEPTDIDRTTLDANVVADEANSGGGAAYLQGTRANITNSTVSRNRAAGSSGLRFHDHGAAQGRADLTNVTIVENAVYDRADPNTNGLAGGLWTVDIDGTLTNCTIARNRAGFGAGILGLGGLTLRNTVVANVAGNVYVNGNCHDFGDAKAAGDHVLQHAAAGTADGDCVAGGVQRGDPLLGALGDHGGPTETALPATGSPAFGAGATCPATDQRGVSRPAACTLGAAEAP